MHALHREAVGIAQQLHAREVQPLLSLRRGDGGGEDIARHEIRQADERDPVEIALAR